MKNPPQPLQTSAQLSLHLKALRKEKGWSQAELGRVLGVGQARVADIENNPGVVGFDQLLQLLHILGARLNLTLPAADLADAAETTTATHSNIKKGVW